MLQRTQHLYLFKRLPPLRHKSLGKWPVSEEAGTYLKSWGSNAEGQPWVSGHRHFQGGPGGTAFLTTGVLSGGFASGVSLCCLNGGPLQVPSPWSSHALPHPWGGSPRSGPSACSPAAPQTCLWCRGPRASRELPPPAPFARLLVATDTMRLSGFSAASSAGISLPEQKTRTRWRTTRQALKINWLGPPFEPWGTLQ